MISSFLKRAKPWIAGAFCMLLVVGGIAPSTARASCGHNVTSDLIRSSRDSVSELELLRYDSSAESVESAPASPRRDLPCSGPSCSQGGRNLPQAPAPTVSVRMSDPWCCTSNSPGWDGPESAEKPAEFSLSSPRHLTSPIERPPRHPQPLARP